MSACYFLPHITTYPQTTFPSPAISRGREQHRNIIMADKEATVYIVDMGRSMGEKRNARKESDLDWAMTYVGEKITSTVGRWKLSLRSSV